MSPGLEKLPNQSRKSLSHVISCRIWRWADLQNCNELKSVGHCQQGYSHHTNLSNGNKGKLDDPSSLVCINPYHYVRIDSYSNSSKSNTDSLINISNSNNQQSMPNTCTQLSSVSKQQYMISVPAPLAPPLPLAPASMPSGNSPTNNELHHLPNAGDLFSGSNYMSPPSLSPSSIPSPSSIGIFFLYFSFFFF